MAVPATIVQLRTAPVSPTLQSHLLAAERAARDDSSKSLTWIVSAISTASKTIAARLRTAGIDGNLGAVGQINVQGESQQALDVIANEVLIRELQSRDGVVVLGSEENDELLVVEDAESSGGRYAVLFDPLDGSSNLDVGGSVGTIFSITKSFPAVSGSSVRGVVRSLRAMYFTALRRSSCSRSGTGLICSFSTLR